MQCSNVSSCIICPPSRGCHFMRQAFSSSLCVSPVPHAAEINQQNHPKHPPNGLVRCRTRSNNILSHFATNSFLELRKCNCGNKGGGGGVASLDWTYSPTNPLRYQEKMPRAVSWLKPERSMHLCAVQQTWLTGMLTLHSQINFFNQSGSASIAKSEDWVTH